MHTQQFTDLPLNPAILRAVAEQGYTEPTPIQLAAIPEILAGGDLMATAQTGTGKTAAFALPMLHLLHERQTRETTHIRALILTPTRELALQIDESFRNYGRHLNLKYAVVLGGVPQGSQVKALGKNPAILIATPGRLLDLMGQGIVRLNRIEILVVDEADRMLDMGFVRDVEKIVRTLPTERQTLFFSATLTPDIVHLASGMLRNPSHVAVTPAASVSGKIEQKVLFVDQAYKRDLLTEILRGETVRKALVFVRTKHRADRILKQLERDGISAGAIHSNKTQSARQRALADFDRGDINVLIGTDIVARGIDVDGITHVINYDLPEDPESYVHRIGRTARAGNSGIAMSLCDSGEVTLLRAIEKLTRDRITEVEDQPYRSDFVAGLRERMAPAVSNKPVQQFGRSKHPRDARQRASR